MKEKETLAFSAMLQPLNIQVLVVSERAPLISAVSSLLQLAPCRETLVDSVRNLEECLQYPVLVIYDVILVEASAETARGLARLREVFDHGSIIVITERDEQNFALECIREGAHDYISLEEISPNSLFRTLRYAVERRRAQQALESSRTQLSQAQKMEAIGRLASGLAHDFRQYVQIIIGNAKALVKKTRDDPEAQRVVEDIRQAGLGANELVRQVLDFARAGPSEVAEADLTQLIESQRGLIEALDEKARVEFSLTQAPVPIQADPVQLSQILLNLVINALDACDHARPVRVSTRRLDLERRYTDRRVTLEPGSYAVLEVQDCGEGIPELFEEKIFEPFFTTKPKDKGTGLGLSTVFNLVNALSGKICFWTLASTGTTFSAFFPVTDRRSDLARLPLPAGLSPLGLYLLDPFERVMLRRDLGEHGVSVQELESPERVQRWLAEEPQRQLVCGARDYLTLQQEDVEQLRGLLITPHLHRDLPPGLHPLPVPFSRRDLLAASALLSAGKPLKREEDVGAPNP